MRSLPSFDRAYPVRTLYTDNEDWRRCEGWQDADRRKDVLQDYLRVPLRQVIYARETHSGSVFAVSSETGGSLAIKKETYVSAPSGGYDALVTDVSGLLLCIWTADCVPLFLYDTTKQVAAVAHCGWRGILDGIVPNTVSVMAEHFGAAPEHIIAGFGPAICGKCYVVSEDLHEAFSMRFSPDEVGQLFCPLANGKYLLDLRMAIRLELRRLGVRPKEIRDTGICSCESEAYASYRRNGPTKPARQTLSGIVLL